MGQIEESWPSEQSPAGRSRAWGTVQAWHNLLTDRQVPSRLRASFSACPVRKEVVKWMAESLPTQILQGSVTVLRPSNAAAICPERGVSKGVFPGRPCGPPASVSM